MAGARCGFEAFAVASAGWSDLMPWPWCRSDGKAQKSKEDAEESYEVRGIPVAAAAATNRSGFEQHRGSNCVEPSSGSKLP